MASVLVEGFDGYVNQYALNPESGFGVRSNVSPMESAKAIACAPDTFGRNRTTTRSSGMMADPPTWSV